MGKGIIVGGRISVEEKAKLTELTNGDGESVNQLVGRLIRQYIQDKEKIKVEHPKEHEAAVKVVEAAKHDPDAVPCPLCEAPLEYHKGWFSDEIRCSNSECDTRGEIALISSMGKPAYLHLLNVQRRVLNNKALNTAENDEKDLFDGV